MKLKKLLSLLLCLTMIFALFAACGSSDSSTDTEETEEETEETTEEEAEEEETEAEAEAEEEVEEAAEEEADVEAEAEETAEEEVTVEEEETAAVTYPLTGDDLTLTVWTAFQSQTGMVEGYEDWPVIAALEEATGVTIEWTQVAQNAASEQFMLMIAADDYCDMIRNFANYYTSGLTDAYENEIIIALNDLIDDYMPNYSSSLEIDSQNVINLSTDDGLILSFSKIQNELFVDTGMTIRQDWLDALGMDTPTTIDELYEVLLAFKTEYGASSPVLVNSGNYGTLFANQYDVAGYDPETASSMFYQIDGTVYCGIIDDNYKDYLTEMKQWYADGLFSSDFMNITSNPKDSTATVMITNGDTGFFSSPIKSWDNYIESSVDPDMALGAVATITKDSDSLNNFPSSASLSYVSANGGWSVTTACDNTELAARWVDYLYTDEAYYLLNYGIEGESYNMVDGEAVWDEDYLNPVAEEYGIGISTLAQGYYGIVNDLLGNVDARQLFQFYSDDYLEAMEIWGDESMIGDDYTLPTSFISLTIDENERASQLISDISTAAAESIAKFITGDMDIETEWDDYVAKIESMGLDELVQIYQDAYDRYLSR